MSNETMLTTAQCLDKIGWGSYQKRKFIQCGLAWTNSQLWVVLIGIILSSISHEWDISNSLRGFIGTLYQIGMLAGSVLWGYWADRYGRMFSFKKSLLIVVIFSLFMIFSFSLVLFIICAFIIGIGVSGELVVSGVVFKEFCPPKNSGYVTALSSFFGMGGAFVALICVLVELFNYSEIANWRLIISFIFFYDLLIFIYRLDMDDTPSYYFAKGSKENSEKILKKIAAVNGKDEAVVALIDPILNENSVSKPKSNSYKMLFHRDHLRASLLLTVIYFTKMFGYVNVLMFMPRFLSEYSKLTQYIAIFIQQLFGIPGVFLAAYLVNTKFGRVKTLAACEFSAALFVFLFLLSGNVVLVVICTSLMSLVVLMGYGCLYTVTPESYPTEIRNTASGWLFSAARIGGIISPTITGVLLDIPGGKEIALAIYSISFLIDTACVLFLAETRQNIIK
ncbi:naiP_2 [Blepharisma stoltei]|uniref:Major facilitator superfamily (MFS) profile domain-containing protein n=1 Tax=Blepharisma stoltei TaxID=1481888 RepID=A0AAU9IUR1_9CILI|nr:unnamed protein product [Blepharisma stoltei]